MKFSFDVGTEESHKVEYSFSLWWGTTFIRVDQVIVFKSLSLVYGLIIGIPFVFGSFVLFLLFNDISFLAIGLILFFITILISFISYRKRFPVSFTVGENEKHTVQIDPKWPRLGLGGGAFSKTEYFIYIDNELFCVKRR